MNQPERRLLLTDQPKATGRRISGIAARFNSRSENLGHPDRPLYEIILPGAFDDVLADDVIACFNHDESKILARSKNGVGSLKLTVDSVGLHYSFDAPDTTVGNDLLESIKRGDISASSFAFVVAPGGDNVTEDSNGRLRTISKIAQLLDVSAVSRPAYSATEVSARSASSALATPRANGWRKLLEILS